MNERTKGMLALALWITCAASAILASNTFSSRIDFTEDKVHTLSPVTQGLLDQLDGPLEIRAFLPMEIPPPYSVVVKNIQERLEDYADASPAPVSIIIKDPQDTSLSESERASLEEEAQGLGIRPSNLEVIQRDKQVRQKVWLGITLLYRDRQIPVPRVDHPNDLEYAMATALRDAVRGPRKRPTIGFSQGHGEPDLSQTPLAGRLISSGRARKILLDGNPIPPDVDTLAVIAPTRPFSERDKLMIDQFLMRGGGLLMLLDYRAQSTVFPNILVPTTTGLEPLVSPCGVSVITELTVVDRGSSKPVPIRQDDSGKVSTGPHPLFARVQLKQHPITRGLGELLMPMASPIDTITVESGTCTVIPLATSFPGTVALKDARDSQPEAYVKGVPAEETAGPFNLSVAIEGTWRSTFADKERPPNPHQSRKVDAKPDPPFLAAAQEDTRVVLMTSGRRLIASNRDALLLIQNALDWLTSDTSLSEIRSRNAMAPVLGPVSQTKKNLARYGTIILPVLLLSLCFILLRVRGDR